ncbi:zinc finger protein-like [Tropilaelaps mercedesae]|uniref:Zinc finger protein-like n=1 Tax=Tropilaelaps mercedesae TaxID=418985 RepID=A0A1V9X4I7_9ACAR|nr:zinc finger protein-like [Tropilaelaps mercedesae]
MSDISWSQPSFFRLTKICLIAFRVSLIAKSLVTVASPLPVPAIPSVGVPTSAAAAAAAAASPIPLVVLPDRDRDLDDTPPPPPAPVTPGSTFIPAELMRQLFDPVKQEYVCPFCLWTTPDEEKVQGHIASHTGEPQKDRDSKRIPPPGTFAGVVAPDQYGRAGRRRVVSVFL